MRKIIITNFSAKDILLLIDALRDSQSALCDLDGNPRKETLDKFLWRQAMEAEFIKELKDLEEA